MSSADWMPRNLYKRIEILFPVEHPATCKMLKKIIDFELADTRKGRVLGSNGIYSATACLGNKNASTRSQKKIYDFLKESTIV